MRPQSQSVPASRGKTTFLYLQDRREKRVDAEGQSRERLSGDQSAADEGDRAHLLLTGFAVGLLHLALLLDGLCERAEDATDGEPQRGHQTDEAPEARSVGAGQKEGVEGEARGEPGLAADDEGLVALARVDELAQELDAEADAQAEVQRGGEVRVGVGQALEDAHELVRERRGPLFRPCHFHTELVQLEHREGVHEDLRQDDAQDRTGRDADHLVAELDHAVRAQSPPGGAVLLHVHTDAARDEEDSCAHDTGPGVLQSDEGHEEDADYERRADGIGVTDASRDAVDQDEHEYQSHREGEGTDRQTQHAGADEEDGCPPEEDPENQPLHIRALPVRLFFFHLLGLETRERLVHDDADVESRGTEDHAQRDDEPDLAEGIALVEPANLHEPRRELRTDDGEDEARNGDAHADDHAGADRSRGQPHGLERSELAARDAEEVAETRTGAELADGSLEQLLVGERAQDVGDSEAGGVGQLHPVDDERSVEHSHADAEHADGREVDDELPGGDLGQTQPEPSLQEDREGAHGCHGGGCSLHVVRTVLALSAVSEGNGTAQDAREHLASHGEPEGEEHERPDDRPERTQDDHGEERQHDVVPRAVEPRQPLEAGLIRDRTPAALRTRDFVQCTHGISSRIRRMVDCPPRSWGSIQFPRRTIAAAETCFAPLPRDRNFP